MFFASYILNFAQDLFIYFEEDKVEPVQLMLINLEYWQSICYLLKKVLREAPSIVI